MRTCVACVYSTDGRTDGHVLVCVRVWSALDLVERWASIDSSAGVQNRQSRDGPLLWEQPCLELTTATLATQSIHPPQPSSALQHAVNKHHCRHPTC